MYAAEYNGYKRRIPSLPLSSPMIKSFVAISIKKDYKLGVCHLMRASSSWNIGRIGRHRAEKPNVEVTMCLGPMPPDASDFPGGIPALAMSL